MNEKENAVANVIWQIVSNVVGGTANMGNLYKRWYIVDVIRNRKNRSIYITIE